MNDVLVYVLSLVPSITSIVGLVTTILVAVKKVKKLNNDASAQIIEIGKTNIELRKQMNLVMAENAVLKQVNADLKHEQLKINARLSHMYFVEKNDKEGE